MTNLVLLSIQLVTNDVSVYGLRYSGPLGRSTNEHCQVLEWGHVATNYYYQKKEVWQLYTIGYHTSPPGFWIGGIYCMTNGIDVPMLTLSNLVGTLSPKQETNWIFTPTK